MEHSIRLERVGFARAHSREAVTAFHHPRKSASSCAGK
jgi:hypothetical protein